MVTMESEYDIYNQYPIEIDNTYVEIIVMMKKVTFYQIDS